ncbi:ribosome maturation factor RimM [Bacillus chungangensis]|uniref:Ribosome maturation factor RimM n=1 Tax=Bacillus chungangensis TaxID=587633 RepID=A0ABT9WSY7_9BACI|nr:ribosome maturation factor RimM [Bacillus chungangensis]MDQ0175845.1 16S rRNA processing protein RimM [Bacillus chungangensis]
MKRWFHVGKIVNTHGLKGEVRVISKTDFPEERYQPGNNLYLFLPDAKQPQKLTIKTHRKHKQFELLCFDGYDHINDVESWKGASLKVNEDQLAPLPDKEYYFHEIIGCTVYTTDNKKLGIVQGILTPGANDVWIVKGEDRKELLIPYIEDVVRTVDVETKTICIYPMEGLLS